MVDENRNGKKSTLRIYMQVIKHVDHNSSVLATLFAVVSLWRP